MVKISGGDGSSLENAIIISDCDHMQGIEVEYIEVRKRFGNYSLIRQNLMEYNNRKIDKLELRLEDGQLIEVYFDITEFFGKGFEF
jgi:hypothetical protein